MSNIMDTGFDDHGLQLCGSSAILTAIERGVRPALVLLADAVDHPVLSKTLDDLAIPVQISTAMDLWRMSRTGEEVDALGLVARTLCNDLMELMAQPGAVWLLSDVAYPSNVGTIIRSAEVTGAVGVVVDGNFNRPARQRAKRVAMRADRFISVLWEDSKHTVLAAQQAGRRVVAVESTGELAPWDVDLTGSVLLIVGGERTGIGDEVLGMANAVVRLPCPGFIPSWNVQAAVAAVAGERLRQQRAASGD